MTFQKLKVIFLTVLIGSLITCASSAQATTTTTSQTLTSSGLTSTQQQQAAQSNQILVDSLNDATSLADNPGDTRILDYFVELNVLYGTSFRPTGPQTAYDTSVLNSIQDASGYDAAEFVETFIKTYSLYKTLQSDDTQLANFNRIYKAYLPKTGTPTAKDRETLYILTKLPVYSAIDFWNALSKSSNDTPAKVEADMTLATQTVFDTILPTTLVTTTATTTSLGSLYSQSTALNLLYGTSFNSSGPRTDYDIYILNSITTAAGYNETTYVALLVKTFNYYKSLQADPVKLASFNLTNKTYLPATGTPTEKDRTFLFNLMKSTTTTTTPATTTPTTTIPTTLDTTLPGEMFFSPTSFWNVKLSSTQPISSKSLALVGELTNQTKYATPWINTDQYSTPLYYVNSSTPKAPVSIVQNGQVLSFTKLNTTLQKGVPIPTNIEVAGGTDGHVTIIDTSADRLYEFWQFKKVNGAWQAAWGGVIDDLDHSSGIFTSTTNNVGGVEYQGATGTGLPLIGGTILLSELKQGIIPHELALAIPQATKGVFVWPAQRSDGYVTGGIPEGTRFRFAPNVYINPSWPPLLKMIVTAIRDYGMVIRDQAGAVTFFGEDPAPYGGGNPYSSYYGGVNSWDLFDSFPWDKLQVLA